MKKLLYLLLVPLCLGTASCSNDDDKDGDDDNSGSASSAVVGLKDKNGNTVRLTSIRRNGEVVGAYFYDANGRLTQVWDGDVWNISSPFTATTKWSEDGDSWDETNVITLNGDGFISTANCTQNYREGSSQSKCTENFTFTYNGHQLAKVTVTGSEESDGSSFSFTQTVLLTWENGNIVKVEETDEGANGDGKKQTYVTVITYGSQANPIRQFPGVFLDVLDFGDSEILSELYALGLIGDGPAYFPTSYTHNGSSRDLSSTWTYTLNENGTIRTEGKYTYGYDETLDLNQLKEEFE